MRRRHLNEVSGTEISIAFGDLRARAERFSSQFGALDPSSKIPWRELGAMQAQWTLIARAARVIGRWILETRAIPRGKTKAVELAVRAFGVKKPRNILAWWKKNERHVEMLLEAEHWPARMLTDDLDELVQVGPFSVHNTVHLTGDALRRTLDVIARTEKAIRASGPEFSRVLYGPIYIVGRLKVPRTLAWYYNKDDTIYLRPMPKDAQRETFNLIHELGHRYWNRFASSQEKRSWVEYDAALRRAPVDVAVPRAGDLIDVHGHDEPVRIREVTYLPRYRDAQAILETGHRVGISSILRVREFAERRKLFPTSYSMTDAEEHFCEAFAMYVLGTLPGDHAAGFERWLEGKSPRSVNRLRRKLIAAY